MNLSFTKSWLPVAVLVVLYLLSVPIADVVVPAHPVAPMPGMAGIALVAVLRFGYRMLAAVVLGNLLFVMISIGLSDFGIAAIGVGIGVGLLQAAQTGLAAWGIRYFQLDPLRPSSSHTLAGFAAVAGPLSCAIGAFGGSVVVMALSPIPLQEAYLHIALIWWMNDSLGAVIVTPLLLPVIDAVAARRRPQEADMRMIERLVLVTLVVGMISYSFVSRQNHQIQENFSQDVALLQARFSVVVQSAFNGLTQFSRQVVTSGQVGANLSPEDFNRKAAALIAANPVIRNVAWVPRVPSDEQLLFVYRSKRLLNDNEFKISRTEDTGVSTAPLMPVQMMYPPGRGRNSHQHWIGVDLTSQGEFASALKRIFTNDEAQILVEEDPDGVGNLVLLLQPVDLVRPSQANGQKDHLLGVMVAVIPVRDMLNAGMRMVGNEDIRLQMVERGESVPFFSSFPPAASEPFAQRTFDLTLPSTVWQFKAQTGPRYVSEQPVNNLLSLQCLLALGGAISVLLILSIRDRERLLMDEVQRQTQALTYRARHDVLTGLPNRSALQERLTERIVVEPKKPFSLLFIDLDRFKIVNDSLGHQCGDELLQQIATGLVQIAGNRGALYRMGGDEFVFHIDGGREEAIRLSEQVLRVCTRPQVVENYHLRVTASIGISLYPDHGNDLETLVKHADAAMYRSKERGKNQYTLYSEELTHEALNFLILEQDLRQALERHQLKLLYQPQYDLETQNLVGVESLVRWDHPKQGRIPPSQFIEFAEETQLIIPLGWQVISMACEQINSWIAQGYEEFPCLAVNISPIQLLQADFVAHLNEIVDAHKVSRMALELEITESSIMQDPEYSMAQINTLSRQGYRIAIDDFGTGYSSMERLKNLPIDRLKIDKSFTSDIGTNIKDEAIIIAIIALGRSLGIDVLAEGIENLEQQQFLLRYGCNSGQGYLYGKPMEAEKLEQKKPKKGVRGMNEQLDLTKS